MNLIESIFGGNSNNANVAASIKQLHELFPTLPVATLEKVLKLHNNDLNLAIEAIVSDPALIKLADQAPPAAPQQPTGPAPLPLAPNLQQGKPDVQDVQHIKQLQSKVR